MLCIPIKGPSLEQARQQLEEAQKYCRLVELRLDLIKDWQLHQIKSLKDAFRLEMIFTLRAASQGGEFSSSEEERLGQLEQLSHLKPEYLDLEYTVPPQFVRQI